MRRHVWTRPYLVASGAVVCELPLCFPAEQRWRPTQGLNLLDLANFEISASKYRVGSKFQCSSSFKSQYSDFIYLPLPVKDRRVAIFLLVLWGRAQYVGVRSVRK